MNPRALIIRTVSAQMLKDQEVAKNYRMNGLRDWRLETGGPEDPVGVLVDFLCYMATDELGCWNGFQSPFAVIGAFAKEFLWGTDPVELAVKLLREFELCTTDPASLAKLIGEDEVAF